jgi:hypothetical protein
VASNDNEHFEAKSAREEVDELLKSADPVLRTTISNTQSATEVEAKTSSGDAQEAKPDIILSPATPSSSLKNRPSNKPDSGPTSLDTGKTTSIFAEESNNSNLKSRKATASPIPERPLTPSSMRAKDPKSRTFLRAFWHVVFVEWIGGFIMRLCGGNRNIE